MNNQQLLWKARSAGAGDRNLFGSRAARTLCLSLLTILLVAALAGGASSQILGYQKISATQGGNVGTLADSTLFGSAIAPIGDLDDDGIPDMVVGCPYDNDGGPYHGAVKILFMRANGTVRASQKISDTAGNFTGVLDDTDLFGFSVAGIGDLDGDGIEDIAVGAIRDDDGGYDCGAVWILFLDRDGTVKYHRKISATQGGFTGPLLQLSYFGSSIVPLGDLDRDGTADLMVGAMTNTDLCAVCGAVWTLFLNSDGSVKASQKISATKGNFGGQLHDIDEFGRSVANIGDLDGDGITDVAVGAWYDDDGGTTGSDRGAVWILFLNTNGTVKSYSKISSTAGGFTGTLQNSDFFGASVAGCGDLDGDDVPDLIVGAEGDHDYGPNRGAAWLVYLNANGTVKSYAKINDGRSDFAGTLGNQFSFGCAVAVLGSLEEDGLTNFAIGSRGDPEGGTWGPVGSLWVLDYLFRDTDSDGVPDGKDGCRGENSSYFDENGDGCVDVQANGRHVEYWPTGTSITFTINADGAPYINDGSDLAAVQAGIQRWYDTGPGFDLGAPRYATAAGQDTARALDGVNTITFTDPEYGFGPAVLAVGLSTSFTTPTYFHGRYYRPGEIVDADLLFNPAHKFTTPSVGGSGTDIQSVATHETGHLLGLSHSAVRSSTMFFVLPPGTRAQSLEPDDVAAFRLAYLDPAALTGQPPQLNLVKGTVRDGLTSTPVPGALVFALKRGTVSDYDTAACDVTLPDGTFKFVLPRGTYYFAIHAMDGSSSIGYLEPGYMNWLVDSTAVTVFPPEFYDGMESGNDNPLDTLGIVVDWGQNGRTIDFLTNVDQMPPTVLNVSPAPSASDVPIDAPILVKFSEAVHPNSIQGNFSLTDAGGAGMSGNASIVSDDSVIAFAHSQPFAFDATYTLTLGTGITDRNGNALESPYVSTFTTQSEPPLDLTGLVPSKGATGSIVALNGRGFDGALASNNNVRFQGSSGPLAASVISATPFQIIALVPAGATSGEVAVEVGSGPWSNGLQYTVLPSGEVARGAQVGSKALGVLPRALTVLPDGSYAYVATAEGAIAVDLRAAHFLDVAPIATGAGLDEIAASPDGKRVYAVSRAAGKLHIIDSDASSATRFQQLNALPVGGEPVSVASDPAGARVFVSLAGGAIQIWDVNPASTTYQRQVGILTSPEPALRGKMAFDWRANRLLALSGSGRLVAFSLEQDAYEVSVTVGSDPRDVVVDPAGQRAYVSDATGVVTVVSLGQLAKVTDISTGGSLRGSAMTPAGCYLYAANRELNILDAIDLNEGTAAYRSITATIPAGINPVDVRISPDGLYAYSLSEGEKKFVVTTIGIGPVITSVSRRAAPVGGKIVFAGTGLEQGTGADYATFTGAGGTTVTDPVDFSTPTSRAFTVPAGAVSGPVTVTVNTPSGPQTSNQIQFEVLGSTASLGELRVAERKGSLPSSLSPVLAVSPLGDQVLVGGTSILFWDTDPKSPTYGAVVRSTTLGAGGATDIVMTPDGKRAYVSSQTPPAVYVLDTDRASTTYTQMLGTVTATGGLPLFTSPGQMAMSPDGEQCIVIDRPASLIHFIDARTGSPTSSMTVDTMHAANIADIAFYPGGRFLYLACDSARSIAVIDAMSGTGTYKQVLGRADACIDWTCEESGRLFPISICFAPTAECYALGTTPLWADNLWPVDFYLLAPDDPKLSGAALQPFDGTTPSGERIRVSPRGDYVLFNGVGTGGLCGFGPVPPFSPRTSPAELGLMDYDFSPDGTRVFAVSTGSADSLLIYEFSKPDSMYIASGNGQRGIVSQTLRMPLRVRAVSDSLAPAAGVSITFSIASGGGAFEGGGTSQTVVTDADGVAKVLWTLGSSVGAQTVEAASRQLAGSPATFTALASDDPSTVPFGLVETLPVQNAAGIGATTSLLASFTRPVKPDTVLIRSNFFLEKEGDPAHVAAVLGFTDSGSKLSLTPSSPLQYGTTYSLRVDSGLQDAQGNPLASPGVATFTIETMAPPLAITSISPTSAVRGGQVVIAGTGFDTVATNNVVRFGAVASAPTRSKLGSLRVAVPPTASSGAVSVQVGNAVSNSIPFMVLIPNHSPADSVIGSIGVSYTTRAAAITPDGSKLYAVSPQSDKVVPISIRNFRSGHAIAVGDHPISIDIDPDGKYAYVANFASGTVSMLDLRAPETRVGEAVETSIVGGNPIDVAVSPDGDRIYVADAASNNLDVIDGDEQSATHHQVIASIATTSTIKSVTVTPDGARIYVGTTTGYVVINAVDYGVLARVPTGSTTKSVTITPDGALLVILTTENELLVLNIVPGARSENQVLARVAVGSTVKSVTVTPDGALIYLIQDESDRIIVFSLEAFGSIGAIDPGAPLPPGSVAVTPVDTVIAGEDPETITFDPTGSGLAVVTNAGPQSVTFITTALPSLVALEIPRDSTITLAASGHPPYVLDGFRITNWAPYALSFRYDVTAMGPGTLLDNANPASLTGTTPLIPSGGTYAPPAAALSFPTINAWAQERVTYDVVAVQEPTISNSRQTLITIQPQGIDVLIQAFEAVPTQGGVRLAWSLSGPDGVRGFNIYRACGEDGRGEAINAGALISPDGAEFVDRTVRGATRYRYTLGVVLTDGSEIASAAQEVLTMPFAFALDRNHPNPFNPRTIISFSLPAKDLVNLSIYNVEGKRIVELINGTLDEGLHEIVWDGSDGKGRAVSSGVYFCRLVAGKNVQTRKLVLMR